MKLHCVLPLFAILFKSVLLIFALVIANILKTIHDTTVISCPLIWFIFYFYTMHKTCIFTQELMKKLKRKKKKFMR